ESGIGTLHIASAPDSRAWVVLLSFLQALPADTSSEERFTQLLHRLAQANVAVFQLEPPNDALDADVDLDVRERARQTYVRSLDVTRDVMSAVRLGRSPSLKRVKR